MSIYCLLHIFKQDIHFKKTKVLKRQKRLIIRKIINNKLKPTIKNCIIDLKKSGLLNQIVSFDNPKLTRKEIRSNLSNMSLEKD